MKIFDVTWNKSFSILNMRYWPWACSCRIQVWYWYLYEGACLLTRIYLVENKMLWEKPIPKNKIMNMEQNIGMKIIATFFAFFSFFSFFSNKWESCWKYKIQMHRRSEIKQDILQHLLYSIPPDFFLLSFPYKLKYWIQL